MDHPTEDAPMISGFFRSRPSAAAPSPPAQARPSDVQDLPILRGIDQAPVYQGLLSGEGGAVALDADDRRRVVILDLGDGRCALVWTNTSTDAEAMRVAVMRLRAQGIAIAQRFAAAADVIALFYQFPNGPAVEAASVETRVSDNGSMERRVEEIVRDAVALNASDIHVRVKEGQPASIDFRVNGDLELYRQLPFEAAQALSYAAFHYAGKAKTGIEFNKDEFQDARIQRPVCIDGALTKVNLRFASKPTYSGWDVVLRVLVEGTAGAHWSLERLGYDAPQESAFGRMLSRPSGLIAVVGTTGSGKSRTLQTLMGMLHQRYGGRKALVTIEDPPEYIIAGGAASQVPVRRTTSAESDDPDADQRAFQRALKACMRADPDVIMLGEVRDRASGRLGQEAVQTGHPLLTTLHAANPFEAMERFIDLGIERTILTGTDFVSGIIYQRLVPVVCPECAIGVDEAKPHLGHDMIARLAKRVGQQWDALRFRGPGCERCRNTGIVGRTVVASVLEPDLDILEYIRQGERNRAYLYWRCAALETADRSIMGRTALDHGIEKMLAGQVCPLDLERDLGLLDAEMTPQQAMQRLQRRGSNAQPVMRREGIA